MINATSDAPDFKKDLIPPGNYVARCYQMIEEGMITESYMGEDKTAKKVRIGWELPTELKVFKAEKGEQPRVISAEYTLSLHEKANLRQILKSWRGQDFTESEAKSFDITRLLGVPCLINIVHKTTGAGKTYANVGAVTPVPKGMTVPPAINPVFVLSYDNWDETKFNALPDFIREKMMGSDEYKAMITPERTG